MNSEKRYHAHFETQVWVNDNAIPVSPKGEDSWDCTEFVNHPPEKHRDYLADIDYDISNDGLFFDIDDVFMNDPNIPPWIKEWDGPFTITVDYFD